MKQVLADWMATPIFDSMGNFFLANLDTDLEWPPTRPPKWRTGKISDLASFETKKDTFSKTS